MGKTSVWVGLATALALLVMTGCGGGSSYSSAPQNNAAEPTPVAAETTTVAVTTTVTTPTATAKPKPVARRTAPVAKPAPSAPLNQSEATFWRLIAETRSAAGNDTGRQSELLKERLTHLSPTAIIAFARTRGMLDKRAYTWKLWGAATVIEDGCSDDCFRDFRGYIISLGRGPYERALHNPDSLASVARDAETGDWENADNVAPDAYSSATGNDFPLDDSDLSGPPSGKSLDLNTRAALLRRFPRLAARFRN